MRGRRGPAVRPACSAFAQVAGVARRIRRGPHRSAVHPQRDSAGQDVLVCGGSPWRRRGGIGADGDAGTSDTRMHAGTVTTSWAGPPLSCAPASTSRTSARTLRTRCAGAGAAGAGHSDPIGRALAPGHGQVRLGIFMMEQGILLADSAVCAPPHPLPPSGASPELSAHAPARAGRVAVRRDLRPRRLRVGAQPRPLPAAHDARAGQYPSGAQGAGRGRAGP